MELVKYPIFVEIWNSKGRLVLSEGKPGVLPQSFRVTPKENYAESGFRNVYRETESGSVRFVVEEDNESFQGAKSLTRAAAIYIGLIPKFEQIENDHRRRFDAIIKRFAHNLVKFQVRFKENFGTLISDQARSRPFSDFREEVKRRIEGNTSAAAEYFCKMSHRAVDLDSQIDTLRVISGYAEHELPESKIKVDLRKAIFRLANPFFEELRKKGIKFELNIPIILTGEDKVLVAPGLLNASLWQLFDNASKYALRNSDIVITADLRSRPQVLEIEMVSVCIEEGEKEDIFLEGYKGRHAGNKAVNGIGLFVVRKALNLMNATIFVHPGDFVEDKDGFRYCKNKFVIKFSF